MYVYGMVPIPYHIDNQQPILLSIVHIVHCHCPLSMSRVFEANAAAAK